MRYVICTLLSVTCLVVVTGCQHAPQHHQERAPKHAIAIQRPGAAQVVKEVGRDRCNKFVDCTPATVFPEHPFTSWGTGSKNCTLPKVIARGGGLTPRNVDPLTNAKVWVAMIVPPDGGRPVVARVVGSDDQRFAASAYAMAMAFVYQPMICQGIAHEAFVVAPFHFGPRPLMSR